MARNVISLDRVSFKYPLSDEPSLVDITYQFEEGKLYGIVGPNGAGKSTLSLLICGFATTSEKGELKGSVKINGTDMEEFSEGSLSGIIGYVMQNPFNQMSGSKDTVFEEIGFGLENLGIAPEEMEDRIVTIAQQTNITDLLLKNPFELSGGQQQRVALASVLVMDPKILVIDEPTSQLDPVGTEGIFSIISKLKTEGKTIILIEHKVDLLAEYADQVIAMNSGRIIAQGTAQEVFTNFALCKQGIQMPHISLLFNGLVQRGKSLSRIPITLQDAFDLLANGELGLKQ